MNCHTCYCNATSNPPCGACEACTHGPDVADDQCEFDCDNCWIDHDNEDQCDDCGAWYDGWHVCSKRRRGPYDRPHVSLYPAPGQSRFGMYRPRPANRFHYDIEPDMTYIDVDRRIRDAIEPQLDALDALRRDHLRAANDERRSRGDLPITFHSEALREAGANLGRLWSQLTGIAKDIRNGFAEGAGLTSKRVDPDNLPAPVPAEDHAGQ